MKYINLIFGYAAASAGTVDYFDSAPRGTCNFIRSETELRVSAHESLYLNGEGCGTCVKLTLGEKEAIAQITQHCKDCNATQIRAGDSVYAKLGQAKGNVTLEFEKVECPLAIPQLAWHTKSYWPKATFAIVGYPGHIKNVAFLNRSNNSWVEAVKDDAGYKLFADGVEDYTFEMKITDSADKVSEYNATYKYDKRTEKDGIYYPGPLFPLKVIKSYSIAPSNDLNQVDPSAAASGTQPDLGAANNGAQLNSTTTVDGTQLNVNPTNNVTQLNSTATVDGTQLNTITTNNATQLNSTEILPQTNGTTNGTTIENDPNKKVEEEEKASTTTSTSSNGFTFQAMLAPTLIALLIQAIAFN